MATNLLPQEIIRTKRDGGPLTEAQIRAFVRGIAEGGVGDSQVGAFAMAVVLRGMGAAETVALTLAMRDSGTVLRWDDMPGPVVDKHSTGGVGDKVSLVLAPLLAACGCYVPMLSGRGLGHTGGTLDKLEAIPGYATRPYLATLRRVVREAGCAIVGPTGDLAPADRRLYAIRDVTATVESTPLITASILSKKLAAGPRALVMDVKVGSGAFLPTREAAEELARSLVTVAGGAGLPTTALLTDMNACLGRTAGNALEAAEAIALLRGDPVDARLREVTLALAAEALVMGGLVTDRTSAHDMAERALAGGAAAERFAAMVRGLDGPGDILERPAEHLPSAPVQLAVHAEEDGHLQRMDVRALGLAVVALGGGRRRTDDPVDHAVGLSDVALPGEIVDRQRPLGVVHAADLPSAEAAATQVRRACTVGGPAQAPPSAILGRID